MHLGEIPNSSGTSKTELEPKIPEFITFLVRSERALERVNDARNDVELSKKKICQEKISF